MERGKALNLAGKLLSLAAYTDNEHEARSAKRAAYRTLERVKIVRTCMWCAGRPCTLRCTGAYNNGLC